MLKGTSCHCFQSLASLHYIFVEGTASCIEVATNLYFENFLYFGKFYLKHQVSILTISLDTYFQEFLVSSILYLFLKGAATIEKYILSYMSINHLMPLETSPSGIAYQTHFRFKQLGDSFWKECLGGVFLNNEKPSYIMKNDIFITFILITDYVKSFDMEELAINSSLAWILKYIN